MAVLEEGAAVEALVAVAITTVEAVTVVVVQEEVDGDLSQLVW